MADIYKGKLTVMADGIVSNIKGKKKGFQLVIGDGFDVADFVQNVKNGDLVIQSNRVALILANDQVCAGLKLNIGKQIEKLIRQIWSVKPKAEVFVSTVLPKPTQETITEAMVIKANQTIATMCRRLMRYGKNPVHYVPMHLKFLEKWRCQDQVGRSKVITRVIQPHGKWFQLGTDKLNEAGVQLVLSELETRMRGAVNFKQKVPLMQRQGLIVQIDNSESGASSNVGEEQNPIVDPVVKPKKGTNAHPYEARRHKPQKGTTKAAHYTESPSKGKADMGQKQGKKTQVSRVARMVDQWEQLSQGAPVENIDVELGEDSIVQVDLGDHPDQLSRWQGE